MMINDALTVDLILNNVFFYLNKRDLFVCTLVSRYWCHMAPKKYLMKFQWDITNDIFVKKKHITKTKQRQLYCFCETFGCELSIHNDGLTSKLMFTSYQQKAISLDLKRKFCKATTVRYIRIPSYFSKDFSTCHYAIIDDILIVDFSDLENPFVCDQQINNDIPINKTNGTFLDIFADIVCLFSKNLISSLPKVNLDLMLKKFPTFEDYLFSNINWTMSKDEVIYGSYSSHDKICFAIFDKTRVKISKTISLDSINLKSKYHNQSRILCNRYLMILAHSGIYVFDCFSESDQALIAITDTLPPHYFAANVALTNTHFICLLGSMLYNRFYYYIFNMNNNTFKQIPNYYNNFFNNVRIEQVSDDILHIHNFYQGKFTIDLSSMSITSFDHRPNTLASSVFNVPIPSIDPSFYKPRHVRGAFASIFGSSIENYLSAN